MPSSGPVYQPTTVQCDTDTNHHHHHHEDHDDQDHHHHQPAGLTSLPAAWTCPKSAALSHTLHRWFTGTRCLLGTVLLVSLVLLITGIKITVDSSSPESSSGLLAAGIIALLVGIGLLGFFIFLLIRRQRGWSRGKGGIEVGSGGGGGGSLGASNPSTDPLVAAQYAPVKDAPPSVDDERRQLMDNKDCLSSAEESDKTVDPDPRIVLKPLKNTEDA